MSQSINITGNENLVKVLHDEGFLNPKQHELKKIHHAIKLDDLKGIGAPSYKYWKSPKNNNWYWHCKSPNGEIMWQGETNGYSSKQECENAIDRCSRYAKYGSVKELSNVSA